MENLHILYFNFFFQKIINFKYVIADWVRSSTSCLQDVNTIRSYSMSLVSHKGGTSFVLWCFVCWKLCFVFAFGCSGFLWFVPACSILLRLVTVCSVFYKRRLSSNNLTANLLKVNFMLDFIANWGKS